MKKLSLKFIKSEVSRILEEDSGPTFEVGLMLMSSLVVGPSIKKVSKFTKLPRNKVAPVFRKFRDNRVFVGNRVAASEWFEEGGGIAFIADTMVGTGLLVKTTAE